VEFFEDLASELHSAWAQQSCDERAFPELATAMLDRFSPGSSITPDDVYRWLIDADHLPRQFDPRSRFGNLALTVASRDGFHIDVLAWTDSTTSIHQHGFSGAFHVLSGSSLHTLWSFQESRRWSDRLKRGQLSVRATEWLRAGSTRLILPDATMIHSLFHLESPTFTVVVRTPSSAVASPQLTYERTGLAYDPFFEHGRVEKIRQLLCMLWASNHPQRLALSEAALQGVDAHSAVGIVFPTRLQSKSMTGALIDILARRDAEFGALLRKTAVDRDRDRALVELRKETHCPRHRMLLALVLNLPDRVSIDRALRQIAPDESPDSWLWDTIRSMHDTAGQQPCRKNVLGLSLNEISEEVVKMLLRGHSVDEVSTTVAGHQELVQDIRVLCSTLSALPVLAPLLQ
jgi:hypothetical protein